MARCVLFAEVPGFYAMVERADDPALARRPVIVGGHPRKRGLVQSATPDALAAGVAVDMPVEDALRLCPAARALRTNMRRYRDVSRHLFACLRRRVARLEPFGLGGAYFDLSALREAPEEIAAALRDAVRGELLLPLRAGIARGKFLARLAAQLAGEDGIRRVAARDERAFLDPLPVTQLEGVGQKTAGVLAELGAHTIGEVAGLGRERLQAAFGTHGLRIHALASLADDAPVRAAPHPQSVSREATLQGASGGAALDLAQLAEQLQELTRELEAELQLHGLTARRVTLKVRYADQSKTTRTRTLPAPAAGAADLNAAASDLLARTQAGSRPLRGIGLQLAQLAPAREANRQLELFSPMR